eukprot:gene53040-12427_t
MRLQQWRAPPVACPDLEQLFKNSAGTACRPQVDSLHGKKVTEIQGPDQ